MRNENHTAGRHWSV